MKMKNYLLTLILASASLQAMNQDVHLVPFDFAKHSNAIHDVFSQIIEENDIENLLILKNKQQITIQVLERSYPTPHSNPHNEVLGAIAYQTQNFPNATKTFINALAIKTEHQRSGYGHLLIDHIESIPTNKPHSISLHPKNDSISFYQELGYTYQEGRPPVDIPSMHKLI